MVSGHKVIALWPNASPVTLSSDTCYGLFMSFLQLNSRLSIQIVASLCKFRFCCSLEQMSWYASFYISLYGLSCPIMGFVLLVRNFFLAIGFGRDCLYRFLLVFLLRLVVRPFLVHHVVGTCFGLESMGICVLPVAVNSGSDNTLLFLSLIHI